jgi:hypothetical protein
LDSLNPLNKYRIIIINPPWVGRAAKGQSKIFPKWIPNTWCEHPRKPDITVQIRPDSRTLAIFFKLLRGIHNTVQGNTIFFFTNRGCKDSEFFFCGDLRVVSCPRQGTLPSPIFDYPSVIPYRRFNPSYACPPHTHTHTCSTKRWSQKSPRMSTERQTVLSLIAEKTKQCIETEKQKYVRKRQRGFNFGRDSGCTIESAHTSLF